MKTINQLDKANAIHKKVMDGSRIQMRSILEPVNYDTTKLGTRQDQLDLIFELFHKSTADLTHEELMLLCTAYIYESFLKGYVMSLITK